MNITLRQLSYFQALCETRHFGRAAERVHVSQPALSTQIKEMEDRLGTALIDRRTREVRLTPMGREVLEVADRVLGEMARLEHTARWQDGLRGRLKLGIIPTVAPYLLPVALPLLRARDVSLDLRLTEAQTGQLLEELSEGKLDAAVLALPAGLPELVERPLFDDYFYLAVSSAQAEVLARGAPPKPQDLNPNRLLLLDEGHCLADQALDVCGTRRDQTRVDLRASSLPTLCGMVAAGFGQTLLPSISLAKEAAAAPDMRLIPFAGRSPRRVIGLVRRDLGGPDGWFQELGDVLEEAGKDLLRSCPMPSLDR